jgi:hypothetical protein
VFRSSEFSRIPKFLTALGGGVDEEMADQARNLRAFIHGIAPQTYPIKEREGAMVGIP